MMRIDSVCRGAAVLLLLWLAIGCAAPGSPASGPLPSHPFPRWVTELERGVTALEEVQLRFGDPVAVEGSDAVGLVWRFATEEVHWPADDPDRPALAANGLPVVREKAWNDRAAEELRAFGLAFESLFVYPARRRPVKTYRTLPSTVHELELVFSDEGLLERFRYAPRADVARVPTLR